MEQKQTSPKSSQTGLPMNDVCVCMCVCVLPHGLCTLPGSSVLGTFQARILEWVAISSSRGSS